MRKTRRLRPLYAALITVAMLGLVSCDHDDDDDDDDDFIEFGPADAGVTFSDVSHLVADHVRGFRFPTSEGYGGAGWLDYDRDGYLDLMLTNEQTFRSTLLRNNGDGTFSDVTEAANADITTGNSGIAIGDIDNDGYPDIFMAGSGFFAGPPPHSPTVMLHNQGDGTFEDISDTDGVEGDETTLAAAFGDINNDGYVDLFIAGQGHLAFGNPAAAEQHEDRLYLNNGDLTFTDITYAAGVEGGLGSCAVSFTHMNDDEFIDILVAVCNDVQLDPTPWHVYINNGDETFTDIARSTGLDKLGYWMSTALGDIDNDGDFDIFGTNLGFAQTHHLWRNNGDGTYVNIADDVMGFNFWAWGATFADFDNDTFQDLYYGGELPGRAPVGKGNPSYLFFNNGDSRFRLDNAALGVNLQGYDATGIAKADYDMDGFVDIIVITSQSAGNPVATPVLLRNNGNTNNSLSIQLVGTVSNAMGIGARIEIISNGGDFQAREIWAGSSFISSESQWPVFGLGKATEADATVYWPSGLVEEFPDLAEGEHHVLTEGTGI